MSQTALILGATGRFGNHAAQAFKRHGWTVRTFDRTGALSLREAATGAAVILNGWNPPYPDWAAKVPGLTEDVIAAAKATGAAVMLPGNVYVFGRDMPPVIGPDVPHRAAHPLGRIRVEMEAAYAASGVKTVILRAGDFIDTRQSGNWLDRVIAAKARKGVLSYPGPLDQAHAWAYLPDVAEAFAGLANKLDALPVFSDLAFEGYTLTGAGLAEAVTAATGRPTRVRRMSWLPFRLAAPVWPLAKHVVEMSYLWRRPHRLDGRALAALLPSLHTTPIDDALRRALEF